MGTRTVVVHCDFAPFDIYGGRPRPKRGLDGPFGNPFSHKPGTSARFRVASRAEAVEKHRAWFLSNPELIERVKREMTGKRIGCWCKFPKNPLPCHCDVYAEVCNGELAPDQGSLF